ncbi:MAG: hypothetical protein PUB69_02705 [Desulfovibrionaceae bacterium]|nr:hypothetical protein [Desulfovibrionaceae bacterium]
MTAAFVLTIVVGLICALGLVRCFSGNREETWSFGGSFFCGAASIFALAYMAHSELTALFWALGAAFGFLLQSRVLVQGVRESRLHAFSDLIRHYVAEGDGSPALMSSVLILVRIGVLSAQILGLMLIFETQADLSPVSSLIWGTLLILCCAMVGGGGTGRLGTTAAAVCSFCFFVLVLAFSPEDLPSFQSFCESVMSTEANGMQVAGTIFLGCAFSFYPPLAAPVLNVRSKSRAAVLVLCVGLIASAFLILEGLAVFGYAEMIPEGASAGQVLNALLGVMPEHFQLIAILLIGVSSTLWGAACLRGGGEAFCRDILPGREAFRWPVMLLLSVTSAFLTFSVAGGMDALLYSCGLYSCGVAMPLMLCMRRYGRVSGSRAFQGVIYGSAMSILAICVHEFYWNYLALFCVLLMTMVREKIEDPKKAGKMRPTWMVFRGRWGGPR